MFTNMSVKELFEMKKVLREEKEILDVNIKANQLPVDEKGRLSWAKVEKTCINGQHTLVEYLYKLQSGTWITSNLEIVAVTRKGSSIKLTCVDTFLGRFTKTIGATTFKNGGFKKMVLDLHNMKVVEHNAYMEEQANKKEQKQQEEQTGRYWRNRYAEMEAKYKASESEVKMGQMKIDELEYENQQKDIQVSKACNMVAGMVQDLRDSEYATAITDAIKVIDDMNLPQSIREKLIQKAIIEATEKIIRKFQ